MATAKPTAGANPTESIDPAEADRLVREQFAVIETGQLDLAWANVTPDFVNHRAATEPAAARGRGPGALHATATWLRTAFSDLRFDVDEVVVSGDRVIVWAVLHGTQTGDFVGYVEDGTIAEVFPPTGRSFAARQVHWFRISDGAIAEHDAVRDDLSMAKQLGWIPPRPAFVARMIIARRRHRRAEPETPQPGWSAPFEW
jgi:predicted ester cyclase